MHTGFISFCDRVCHNIKSLDTKDIILNDLASRFDVHILTRHWHRLDDKGMQHVRRVPHLACLRSNGNPYFMFITRYEDMPIIFYVDKKVQPGYQKPRIIVGRGLWSDELSDGTLFDGEMVKDRNGKWIFLINDLIAHCGCLQTQVLPERLTLITKTLENMYIPDSTLDVCTFQLKRYAHATQSGTQALIDWSQTLPYTNRGIYYWPYSHKYKPKLHNFDETLIKAVSVKVKDNPQFRTELASPVPSATPVTSIPATQTQTHTPNERNDDVSDGSRASTPRPATPDNNSGTNVIANGNVSIGGCVDLNDTDSHILWLRKTEYPDVYDVYPTDNGMLHGNKIGIAFVKTLEDSRYLRDVFKKATVAIYIPFQCVKENNKWKPVALAAVAAVAAV